MQVFWKIIESRTVRLLSAIVVVGVGVYSGFFYERKPELAFEIVSSSSVLDIREKLSNLAVIYDGTNLRTTNQNLHLLVVRVGNYGSSDILKSHFDDLSPLGFRVSSGKIVESPAVIADDYLKANLKPTIRENNTVVFSPVILNAGDSFEVRVLLLITLGESPIISPTGKIAGVHTISVTHQHKDSKSRSYLDEAFGGEPAIQVGRLFTYAIVFIALLIAIVVIAIFISNKIDRFKRSQLADRYRSTVGRKLNLKEEYLLSEYVRQTTNFALFLTVIKPPSRRSRSRGTVTYEWSEADARIFTATTGLRTDAGYEELEANGLIVRDGPQVSVHPEFQVQAQQFLTFVGAIKTKSVTETASS